MILKDEGPLLGVIWISYCMLGCLIYVRGDFRIFVIIIASLILTANAFFMKNFVFPAEN